MHDRIAVLADKIKDRTIAIRHDIHKHPEIGYNENRTADVIERFLDDEGITHHRRAGTGIVAETGSKTGRIVALRSEMDALPMSDLSGLPWASAEDGKAHACGHDGHIAILLGAAWVLKQIENDLRGSVKLIWQPAEEGGGGAARMLEEGVFDPQSPEAVFALHGWPGLQVGQAGYRFGAAMASVDNFEINVIGKGSHGAMPHAGVDPIVISARIIEGLQHVASRMIDPLDPVVVTVGMIEGGTAVNVIPDNVRMKGTIRTLDPHTREKVRKLMERMVVHTASASGGTAELKFLDGYPTTINETRATVFARDTLRHILGEENVVEITTPVMGGEDFSFYLERIPGSFFRLGMGEKPPLHNSSYDFEDKAIPYGIRVMAGLAWEFLSRGLPTI